jgi:signal transduction histidine kinase
VRISVSQGVQSVLVRVADDGPGVAPEVRRTLFERGVRGTRSSGDGLGLHIARRLIRNQGGDLWLEECPAGTGACFALVLPASLPEACA